MLKKHFKASAEEIQLAARVVKEQASKASPADLQVATCTVVKKANGEISAYLDLLNNGGNYYSVFDHKTACLAFIYKLDDAHGRTIQELKAPPSKVVNAFNRCIAQFMDQDEGGLTIRGGVLVPKQLTYTPEPVHVPDLTPVLAQESLPAPDVELPPAPFDEGTFTV